MPAEDTLDRVRRAAALLVEKKAVDVVLLQTSRNAAMNGWFVIATGQNGPHLRALAEAIEENFSGLHHREGRRGSRWQLLDYGDIVIHLFLEEARQFYDLERLWGDVPRFTAEDALSLTLKEHAAILT